MKKIVTDKDKLKELEKSHEALQNVLDVVLDKNERLNEQLDSNLQRILDLKKENNNLKCILHYNTLALVLLSLVEQKCSYTSDTETAFSTAIKRYKKDIVRAVSDIPHDEDYDIEPYYMDDDDVFGDEDEDGENGNEEEEE
jgi:hypothetical protein